MRSDNGLQTSVMQCWAQRSWRRQTSATFSSKSRGAECCQNDPLGRW